MAIVFLKELDNTKINLAYNNNVVKFYTDSAEAPINATISIGFNSVTLYPDPNGNFNYNFKDLISTLLNVDNFADDLEVNLSTSFVYDWTDKISLDEDVITTINLADKTSETDTRKITWLSAFVQLRDWKTTYLPNDILTGESVLLQKKNTNSGFTYRLNYWEGYPFDLTIWNSTNEDIDIENITNSGSIVISTTDKIDRLVFSDGRLTPSLEEDLNIQEGLNNLVFSYIGGTFNLALNKITNYCENGIYIKWINSFGGWNYWLFSKGQEQLKTKELGVLNNDFNNLEDTLSPLVSLGKTSESLIKVREQRIKEYDKIILSDLLDSAKVYLFTGTPYARNYANDWMEVNLASGSFVLENPRSDLYTLNLTIELPTNITRTL